MKDFTIKIYEQLLTILISNEFVFLTVEEYFDSGKSLSKPFILMRHDVDRRPGHALRMAKKENEFGVKAIYYFRTIPQTFKPEIIQEIAELGHEIGYHYECLAETNGDYEEAVEDFKNNLTNLRKIYPIKNIAMHGRPTSKWDSRLLWKKYDYKKYDLLSEPYFDIDFNKVLYITDAGRSWNNENMNLRDKVKSKFVFSFNQTEDIIQALEKNGLPNKLMINIHPEHWADTSAEWWRIWIVRKIKNYGKRIFLGFRLKV